MRSVVSTILMLMVLGCAASSTKVPVMSEAQFVMPSLTLLEGSSRTQEKSGVRIETETPTFKAVKMYRLLYSPKFTPLQLAGSRNYELRMEPWYAVSPQELELKIRMTNLLDHVLKLSGTVVAVQLDGRMVDIKPEGLSKVKLGFVLPQQTLEFSLSLEKAIQSSEQCVVTFSIYEIVTKTDAAGNATERTSFTWEYAYKTDAVRRSDEVRIQKVYTTPQEVASRHGGTGLWSQLPSK